MARRPYTLFTLPQPQIDPDKRQAIMALFSWGNLSIPAVPKICSQKGKSFVILALRKQETGWVIL